VSDNRVVIKTGIRKTVMLMLERFISRVSNPKS
jgi:hypothetical protein